MVEMDAEKKWVNVYQDDGFCPYCLKKLTYHPCCCADGTFYSCDDPECAVNSKREKKNKVITFEDYNEFWVYGEPIPKGSTRAFHIPKLNRTVTTDSNPNVKKWQARIAEEAQKQERTNPIFDADKMTGYEVECWFYTQKPKSKAKKFLFWTTRPDIDKLSRAVLDGLTGVSLADDSQVIDLIAHKRYCENAEQPPGVKIKITKTR
jgi:crossover junction endodeoxyribonuclease RusA